MSVFYFIQDVQGFNAQVYFNVGDQLVFSL